MSKHAALDRFGRSGNPLIRSDLFNQTALDNGACSIRSFW